MNYNVTEKIEEIRIKQGKTKKFLYDGLGMTANGFDDMIKKNTISVVKLIQIARLLRTNICEFFNDLPATDTQEETANTAEFKAIKAENEALKRENELLRDFNTHLKTSLTNATRTDTNQPPAKTPTTTERIATTAN